MKKIIIILLVIAISASAGATDWEAKVDTSIAVFRAFAPTLTGNSLTDKDVSQVKSFMGNLSDASATLEKANLLQTHMRLVVELEFNNGTYKVDLPKLKDSLKKINVGNRTAFIYAKLYVSMEEEIKYPGFQANELCKAFMKKCKLPTGWIIFPSMEFSDKTGISVQVMSYDASSKGTNNHVQTVWDKYVNSIGELVNKVEDNQDAVRAEILKATSGNTVYMDWADLNLSMDTIKCFDIELDSDGEPVVHRKVLRGITTFIRDSALVDPSAYGVLILSIGTFDTDQNQAKANRETLQDIIATGMNIGRSAKVIMLQRSDYIGSDPGLKVCTMRTQTPETESAGSDLEGLLEKASKVNNSSQFWNQVKTNPGG